MVSCSTLGALMFMLEAGKSCVSDAIGMEDAKDIGNRLGKTIKLKKRMKDQGWV